MERVEPVWHRPSSVWGRGGRATGATVIVSARLLDNPREAVVVPAQFPLNPRRTQTLVVFDETENSMKKIGTFAAVLLLGSVVAAYAQNSRGASENSPGDRMHDQSPTLSGKTGPGASQYAPGHEQRKPGGASEMSPGDRMNDTRGQGGR
jgi:hypothetical protein